MGIFLFVIMCIIAVVIIVAAFRESLEDGFMALTIIFVSLPLFTFFVCIPAQSAFGGGLMPDYSNGFRDGYVTKLSNTGLFFKTNDGQLQLGTGNMSALQEPFQFSVPNDGLVTELTDLANKGCRVRLHYTQYLIPNWRETDSGYVVNSYDVLECE